MSLTPSSGLLSRAAAPLAALGLLATLLGAAPAVAAARPPFPITVAAANGAVRVPVRPTRVVSLSPTATEDLFAIGAGRQVIAVDSDSTYPKAAPRTSLSAYTPNVEAIAAYRPDLVVVSGDEGGVIQGLERVGIPVIEAPAVANLAGEYAQIELLGRATGHLGGAARLVRTMRAELTAVVRAAPAATRGDRYYVELDPTLYSATSKTFIGSIFSLFGLRNIADRAAGAAGGYPQLSSEYVVASNPRLVFLADTLCCGQSVATVKRRPGWSRLAAVRHGGVVMLNDDVASRWGPRVVVLARDIERALERVARG